MNLSQIDQARQLRVALRQAALLEFSQGDRLEHLTTLRSMVFECVPAAGRTVLMACVSISQAHLELGAVLARASQVWPPPPVASIIAAYEVFLTRICGLNGEDQELFFLFCC